MKTKRIPLKERLANEYKRGYDNGRSEEANLRRVQDHNKRLDKHLVLLAAQTEVIRQGGQAIQAITSAIDSGTKLAADARIRL